MNLFTVEDRTHWMTDGILQLLNIGTDQKLGCLVRVEDPQ